MRILLLAPLALAACSPATEQANTTAPEKGVTAETAPANGAAIGAPAPSHDDPAPPVTNATDGAPARFVGRWAANAQLCERGAWNFEEKKLGTAGEVSCDFDRVTHVADGYDIAARCLAEGVTANETIKLRFPENPDTMQVESKTFSPIVLKRCG